MLLLFTDLDGCLLNSHDYDYRPAVPTLQELKRRNVPVILASSKTESELVLLADELELNPAPLICENGGCILWRDESLSANERTVCGAARPDILNVLSRLKSVFRFRSFADLQLDGVIQSTGLPEDRAVRALDRHSTEPLIWDDDAARIDDFRDALNDADLTLTKGGRFWHVAGHASKGTAMHQVIESYQAVFGVAAQTIAVGDSPIDQSMLDRADRAVGIPDPDGNRNVSVGSEGIFASIPGAAGWAESVGRLLDQ